MSPAQEAYEVLSHEGLIEETEKISEVTVYCIIIACFGVLFGTFLRWLETQFVPVLQETRFKRFIFVPPYTLSIFLAGVLTSVLHDAINGFFRDDAVLVAHAAEEGGRHLSEAGGVVHNLWAEAVASAQIVDPHVILLVLLPPLIYESASHVSWHVFSKVFGQAFILAFPGVIIQAYMVAAFFRYAMNYGSEAEHGLWDWDIALCLGSIVTATDPVAVVAALNSLGAPEKLADVIDGEALLNDGSAMVMYLIFIENVRSKAAGIPVHTLASGTAVFFQLALGGCAFGGLAFTVVSTWLLFIENDWRVELGVLLVGIYGTFSLAEKAFHVSGVLAVVTLGLLMSRRGKYAFSPKATEVAHAASPLIAHVSETLIFYVAGIVAWNALYAHRAEVHYTDALILFCVLILVRALTMLLLYPLLSRMGYKLNWREGTIVVYAGLRGAVCLALALLAIAEESMPSLDRARIHFLVASTTVLTMLINGTTTDALYQKLRLYPANAYRNVIVQRVMRDLEAESMDEIQARLLKTDKLYRRADWACVRALVPCFHGVAVLPNNRLQLPDTVRTHVFDPDLLHRIVRSEPGVLAHASDHDHAHAEHSTHAAARPSDLAVKRGRARSDATAIRAAFVRHSPAAPSAAETPLPEPAAHRDRRNSTGAIEDMKEMLSAGVDADNLDPRRKWRAEAEELHKKGALDRRRVLSSSAQSRGGALLSLAHAAVQPATAAEAAEPQPRSEIEAAAKPETPAAAAAAADGAAPPPDLLAAADRLASLMHRDQRLQPGGTQRGNGGGGGGGAHGGGFNDKSTMGSENLRGSFDLPSAEYTRADKRDGIVETLFAVIRKLYSEQYEKKQLAGGPLAALIEALSSGEEYLADFPEATAKDAFELELNVLLYLLPADPAWRRLLHRLPLVGEPLKTQFDFYRAFDRTEALAGFIRAHEELAHVLSKDATRMRVVREAVAPALARAERELEAHHLSQWALVSYQINMLTARAVVLMKRGALHHFAETGALTGADVSQLEPVFDRAVYVLDTVRFSFAAPFRFWSIISHCARCQAPDASADGGPLKGMAAVPLPVVCEASELAVAGAGAAGPTPTVDVEPLSVHGGN